MSQNELQNTINVFSSNNYLVTESISNELIEDTFFNVPDSEARQEIYNQVNNLKMILN